MAARKFDALSVLRADKAAARRLAEITGVERMRAVLARAQRELDERLAKAEGLRGASSTNFTQAQLRASLAQVRAVIASMSPAVRAAVLTTGGEAAGTATKQAVDYLQRADAQFRGVARPLALDTALIHDRAVSGTESSMLHRLSGDPKKGPAILARYGAAVIQSFEDRLSQRLVQQKPWDDVRKELVADSPFLKQAPAHWAERIVRTESMYAHNRAGFLALEEANAELGDMLKILSATFDARTGSDSYAVHGQIRRVNEPFESWHGSYMHPPDRPNDREVVVPHRMSWPLPAELKPRGDSEISARWAAEGRKGSPPARPRISTVDVSKIGLDLPPSAATLPPFVEPEPAATATAPPRAPAADPVPTPREAAEAAPVPRATARDDISPMLEFEQPIRQTKLGGGVNPSFVLEWQRGGAEVERGVWKPSSGEESALRPTIEAGTYFLRESAAYELDRLFGGETVVPPTVARKVGNEKGSLQKFVPGSKVLEDAIGVQLFVQGQGMQYRGGIVNPLDPELHNHPDLRRIALLDYVSGNDDRHVGNVMVRQEPGGNVRFVAIDNGLAFPNGFTIRHVFPAVRSLEGKQAMLELDGMQKKMLAELDVETVARSLLGTGLEADATRRALGRIMALKRDGAIVSNEQVGQDPGIKVNSWVSGDYESRLKPSDKKKIEAAMTAALSDASPTPTKPKRKPAKRKK